MKNKQIVLFAILSAVFTVWACQFIFSSNSQMLGISTADSYQGFQVINKSADLIRSGHLPFGVFWLPDFFGGSIATYFYGSIIPGITSTSLMAINAISNSLTLSIKILTLISLVIAQFCSYKLAKFYFKNTAVAWIFSVAYSFSTFFPSVSNDGHISFFIAAALVPAVLLLFEKMLISLNRKTMVYASLALIVLFFADLQITMFTIYYLLLRIAYYVLTVNSAQKILTLKRLLECAALFCLSIAPFLISFSLLQNVQALNVPQIPSEYIINPSAFFQIFGGGTALASGAPMTSFYLGLIVFAFCIVPILFYKIQSKPDRRNYLFHFIAFVFFFLIAIGTPLSTLVTQLFVRVPSRAQILVVFSVCMCACYGMLCLRDVLNQKQLRFNRLTKNKWLHTLIIVGLAAIIFVDLNASVSTVLSPVPKLTGGDNFIANQQGDFRILEYPIVWGYSNYESSLINHEIIGVSIISLRSYPTASLAFSNLANTFEGINQPETVDQGNFALQATLCGVKYILIQTNNSQASDYLNYFGNSTQYFALAYKDQYSVVYQNLFFKGTAFALKDEGQMPTLENLTMQNFLAMTLNNSEVNVTQGFNRIQVNGYVPTSAYVVLSQSYSKYWVSNASNTCAFNEFLNVSAFHTEKGTFQETATFSVTNQTTNLYITFFVPLFLAGVILYASSKAKKNLLKFTIWATFAFGLAVTFLAFLGTGVAPQFLKNGAIFAGAFNKVSLLWGAVLTATTLALLNWRKFLGLISYVWLSARKISAAAGTRVQSKWLIAAGLMGSLTLVVTAFLGFASENTVFQLQQTGFNGNIVDSYVGVGSQFSLNLCSLGLLLAALVFLVAIEFFVAHQLFSELKGGKVTTKLVELAALCLASLTILSVIFLEGLRFSVNLANDQFFWFMLLMFSSLSMVTILNLRGSAPLTSSTVFQKLNSTRKTAGSLMQLVIVVSLLFIVLSNLPSLFSDSITWLNNSIVLILLFSLFIYIWVTIPFLAPEDFKLHLKAFLITPAKKDSKQTGIKSLHLGILGGIIGMCISGFLIREITQATQSFVPLSLILCGALGGLGFGGLTNGDRKLRGIIGCLFGFTSILFGLMMAYTTPIIIGYLNAQGTPLYMWHGYSFGSFAESQLLTLNGIFYTFFGLVVAYLGGSMLSLNLKLKKQPTPKTTTN